jgi:hypothetical protein
VVPGSARGRADGLTLTPRFALLPQQPAPVMELQSAERTMIQSATEQTLQSVPGMPAHAFNAIAGRKVAQMEGSAFGTTSRLRKPESIASRFYDPPLTFGAFVDRSAHEALPERSVDPVDLTAIPTLRHSSMVIRSCYEINTLTNVYIPVNHSASVFGTTVAAKSGASPEWSVRLK